MQDTKINIQKSVPFLYPKTNYQKEKLRKVPFTIASKRVKYLGINLTEEMKNLYSENYKILMKKLKKTQINEKILVFMDQKN